MGTVIKAGTIGRIKKRMETLRLNDHMAEARAVIQRARETANSILREAHEEAAILTKEAGERGYQDGHVLGREAGHEVGRKESFEEGKNEFRAEQDLLVSSLSEMLSRTQAEKQALLDRAERDLLSFAVMLSRRITKEAGVADRDVVIRNAREAIEHIGDFTDLTIRVNPVDVARMEIYAGSLAEQLGRLTHMRVMQDEKIVPGGCIVETPETHVDATLDAQFSQAASLLLGEPVPWVDPTDRDDILPSDAPSDEAGYEGGHP